MNKNGFTLLEVTLFLAISGALALIAFVGLGPRLRNLRFTTAVRDLEKSINSNLSASVKGQNARANIGGCDTSGSEIVISPGSSVQAGSAGECVSNGVIAIFDKRQNKLLFRNIVSLRKEQPDSCVVENFTTLMSCHKPTIVSQNATTYKYRDGLEAQVPETSAINGFTKGYGDNIGFGYVADPNSNQVYRFIATPQLFFTGTLGSSKIRVFSAQNDAFNMCYKLDTRIAKFTFSNKSLQPTVRLNEGCGA